MCGLLELLGSGTTTQPELPEPAADALRIIMAAGAAGISGDLAASGALENIVRLVDMLLRTESMQTEAVGALSTLAVDADNSRAIAAAGGIPLLVSVLVSHASEEVQQQALATMELVHRHDGDKVTITNVAALVPLVRLLGPAAPQSGGPAAQPAGAWAQPVGPVRFGWARPGESAQFGWPGGSAQQPQGPAQQQQQQQQQQPSGITPPPGVSMLAAETLNLLAYTVDNATAIVAAGALPRLVALLGPQHSTEMHLAVAGALRKLAVTPGNSVAIKAAGAVSPLIALLGRGVPSKVRLQAAGALKSLTDKAYILHLLDSVIRGCMADDA